MEYKIYGYRRKPVLFFPTSCGRFFQYEDSGMIESLENYINEGKIQILTCDSIASETFFSSNWDKDDRINKHELYDKYITQELIPSILSKNKISNCNCDQRILVTGCSMGAYSVQTFSLGILSILII